MRKELSPLCFQVVGAFLEPREGASEVQGALEKFHADDTEHLRKAKGEGTHITTLRVRLRPGDSRARK